MFCQALVHLCAHDLRLALLANRWLSFLHCSLIPARQAFGTNASRAACKNVGARAIIDKIKKVIEHLNKSPSFKVTFVFSATCFQVLLWWCRLGRATHLDFSLSYAPSCASIYARVVDSYSYVQNEKSCSSALTFFVWKRHSTDFVPRSPPASG